MSKGIRWKTASPPVVELRLNRLLQVLFFLLTALFETIPFSKTHNVNLHYNLSPVARTELLKTFKQPLYNNFQKLPTLPDSHLSTINCHHSWKSSSVCLGAFWICQGIYGRRFSDHWEARSSFHSSVFESVYITTQYTIMCRQKKCVFVGSLEVMVIGPKLSHLGPIRRILSH